MKLRYHITVLFTVAIIAVCGISLTGCNTVEGAGEDIEATGEAIQDGAN